MMSTRKAGARPLAPLLLAAALLAGCAQEPTAAPASSPAPGIAAGQTAGGAAAPASAMPEAGTAAPGASPAPGSPPAAVASAAAQASAGPASARPQSPGASQPPGDGIAAASQAAASAGAASPGPAAQGAQPQASAAAAQAAPPSAAVKPAAPAQPKATAAGPSPSPSGGGQPAADQAAAVTMSIVGDDELGTILPPTPVQVEEGDSALDVLKRVTRQHKIQMEFRGAKAAGYVEGIANLYELDRGAESGWMYRVNGKFPSESAGSYGLKPGDTVEWLYTLDMGKDLGASK